jgi:type I restriction enzyme S subunit
MVHGDLSNPMKPRRLEPPQLSTKFGTPSDDSWREKYEEPVAPDTADLPDLPEGWCWATVGQLAPVASGQTPSGIADCLKDNGGIPWFRVGDMNTIGNEVVMRHASNWIDAVDATRLGLHVRPEGTIVFPKRGGAIATNKKRRLCCPSAYDLNTMGIMPVQFVGEYVWTWFQTIDLRSLSDGSNVPQINHGDIEPLPIPLPPLPEQARIVAVIEDAVSLTTSVERAVDADERRCSRLRQAILKWAFEGRLADQYPDDEPASALLARIKAERETAQGPTKNNPARRNRRGRGMA